jgi:hypothetical protein
VNFALGIRTLGKIYARSHLPTDTLFQDTWRGVYLRWHISFNIVMLRCDSSFSIDYHRACNYIGILDVRYSPFLWVHGLLQNKYNLTKRQEAHLCFPPTRYIYLLGLSCIRAQVGRRSTWQGRYSASNILWGRCAQIFPSSILLQMLQSSFHTQKISRYGRLCDRESDFSSLTTETFMHVMQFVTIKDAHA